MSAESRSVHLSDPVLSQDVLLANLADSIAGHPSDRLLKTLAWLFTAHVNDRLQPDYTWIPRYAALIGPYGRSNGPSLDEIERLIRHSFEDFLLLMPGSSYGDRAGGKLRGQ
ncbi:hypothetical protein FZ103_10660 [Streptomonospora sp. PA3]|uniref:hypothetical protein n=1 Tax=Streptomonospora sp. PA3 TaxID=2607326 RepID=UPI0012DC755D|nr:hypothetical protein [Streptomonospora sp. PA3]MUL41631.1 hypothetical protein [Streptomonospora sp. PA3]